MPFPKFNFVHENVGVIFSVHTLLKLNLLSLSSYRHRGPVMTTGVNSDIVKACGIAFTIITLTARPHPVSSGKRTIITAKNGRNTKVLRPRYSCSQMREKST